MSDDELLEALGTYTDQGYTSSFQAGADGSIICLNCHGQALATDVRLDALHRLEGTSDPDDEAAILALTCPDCHAKGTVVIQYGASASAAEAKLLLGLQDHRAAGGRVPGI